jgi:predicted phosphoribosyltransferase
MSFIRYDSREEAGKILAKMLKTQNDQLYSKLNKDTNIAFCFAIPNGGVPVAEGFCSELGIKYDIIILRKIKIPYNPEAGFGSVTTDGTVLINEDLLPHLNLSQREIDKAIKRTNEEIAERLKFYKKDKWAEKNYHEIIKEKKIFLIDDGLASGFTMFAAIKMVKKYNPDSIIIAVPTAPHRTVQKIQPKVDKIICPNIKNVFRFAVADAYKNWYDMSEEEVLEILEKSNLYYNL